MSIHRQEEALHRAIVASPGDAVLWLILADWLEEHDDPRRAELLRLHRKLLDTCCEPDSHPERGAWQARIVELLTVGVRPSVPRQKVTLAGGVEMAFHFIPPGSFLMGSPESERRREAQEEQHPVTLMQGFWLGVTPVTQAQWQAVLGCNPSSFQNALHPVESVSWQDCQEYCRGLGEKASREVRLPTEAEWEYACRAGTTTPFFFGQTLSTEWASHATDYYDAARMNEAFRKQTTMVGSFPCNAWGLFDMHGNVWEWCRDWFGPYRKASTRDPRGPKRGSRRTMRGGSWDNPAWCCRSALRNRYTPLSADPRCGCRLVLCPS